MINIRVFYTKTGRSKYISHLDVNRCMQRAIKRSRLPVWYTEGFNPHMYLAFPMPISLGFQSLCETMELRLLEPIPFEEVKDRLNACLPEGMKVTKVEAPIIKPDQIAWADYTITFASDMLSPAELQTAFEVFWKRDQLVVEKKSKKGMLQIDIKPMIQIAKIESEQTALAVSGLFKASLEQSINPNLLVQAFLNENPQIYLKDITKSTLLTADHTVFA